MRSVECQGMSFVTTNDVGDALRNFSRAAQRRGRVVRIDVPIVPDPETGTQVLSLVLSPGEALEIVDSDQPEDGGESR
jgi:hypothetical protein